MKKLLLISGLLLVFLFGLSPGDNSETERALTEQQASIQGEEAGKDLQKRFEQISKDMRNSHCLTPRRHVQSSNIMPHSRVVRHATRIIQDIRLKEVSQLQRVTEYETLRQTINYSTLLCRTGYYIYALRKIIL